MGLNRYYFLNKKVILTAIESAVQYIQPRLSETITYPFDRNNNREEKYGNKHGVGAGGWSGVEGVFGEGVGGWPTNSRNAEKRVLVPLKLKWYVHYLNPPRFAALIWFFHKNSTKNIKILLYFKPGYIYLVAMLNYFQWFGT